ncbi:HTH-type transcriptional regulator lrs14 [Bienertia sinuspersici]
MSVKVEVCTENFILCNIFDGPYYYYICFLNGAPKIENREEIWRTLSEIFVRHQGPLVILGDFNQVEFADQKGGGTRYIPGAKKFTEWRLDRAYCNAEWRSIFPDALVINHEMIVSDHGAILLEASPKKTRRRRPYKIEAWCLDDPQIKEIIHQIWTEKEVGSPMFKNMRRLKSMQNLVLGTQETTWDYLGYVH